ncbi:conserved hypothetical protein [gamma proteobacterium HTCC5015]|nr:conserved hypothetical protein [gamma proteobacterium HTCC5015]
MSDQQQPSQHDQDKVTFWQMVASVLMSFLGVQRGSVRERDFEKGKPIHFIVIGLVLTILLVLGLVLIVKLVLSQAGVS